MIVSLNSSSSSARHERTSEAKTGQSGAIRGNPGQSGAIRGNPRPRLAMPQNVSGVALLSDILFFRWQVDSNRAPFLTFLAVWGVIDSNRPLPPFRGNLEAIDFNRHHSGLFSQFRVSSWFRISLKKMRPSSTIKLKKVSKMKGTGRCRFVGFNARPLVFYVNFGGQR